MPTYTVKSSGGDYTSLSAAEAARNGNHVSAAAITTIECYGFTDTTAVTINGGTSNSSYYFEVITTGDGVHSGKWTSGAYILNVTATIAVNSQDNYVRIRGLQLEMSRSSDSSNLIALLTQAGHNQTINRVILRRTGTNPGLAGFFNNACNDCVFSNCLAYDFSTGADGSGFRFAGGTGTVIYNCGVHNCYEGYRSTAGIQTSYNCWNQNASSAGWSLNWTGDYNLTDEASAGNMPGANSVANASLTFADEANDDFHLVAGDTAAIGAAFDYSGVFTDDIDGDTRSSWDIGPDEYISSGSVVSIARTNYLTLMSVGP